MNGRPDDGYGKPMEANSGAPVFEGSGDTTSTDVVPVLFLEKFIYKVTW